MAPMITTIARPSGPPVSMLSRKLTNSMPKRLNSSSTSRKWRTERAMRSHAQTRTACLHAADPVGVLLCDFVAALGSHLPQVVHLGLRVLINGAHPEVKRGAFHRRRAPYFST